MAHLENAREESIQKKLRDAAAQRRKSLTKYDEIAKTDSPGKNMATHLQTAIQETQKFVRQSTLPSQLTQSTAPSLDNMQEGIKMRLSEAKERQNKILTSFDERAKAPKDCKPLRKLIVGQFVELFKLIKVSFTLTATKVSPMSKFKEMDAANNNITQPDKPM